MYIFLGDKMFFYYENKAVSIKIDVNVCKPLIDDLVYYGCLDDDVDVDDYDDTYDTYDIDDVISDAIIDYINDRVDTLIDDGDDDIINESNPVYQAVCVLSENRHINKYISWKYSN